MLCLAGSIVPSRSTNRRPKRRVHVPYQLEFCITKEPHPAVPSLWEDLDTEQRAALTTMLARMISRAVHPPLSHDDEEEDDHER